MPGLFIEFKDLHGIFVENSLNFHLSFTDFDFRIILGIKYPESILNVIKMM